MGKKGQHRKSQNDDMVRESVPSCEFGATVDTPEACFREVMQRCEVKDARPKIDVSKDLSPTYRTRDSIFVIVGGAHVFWRVK